MAKDQPEEQKPRQLSDAEKRYQVTKGSVGDWEKDEVFSLEQFKAAHPLDDATARKNQFDAATYHADLLDRLLVLEVIQPTSEPVSPMPNGPHNYAGQAIAKPNASIKAATEAAKAQRAARLHAVSVDAASRAATAAEPVKQ